ncbi:unnamed protein product [Sympodiomycopsis kandeliae]
MTTTMPRSSHKRSRSGRRRSRLLVWAVVAIICCLAQVSLAWTPGSAEEDHPLHDLIRRSSSNVNSSLVETAKMSLFAGQRASWEQGVAQTALTELDAGQWSVFAGKKGGPPYRPGHLRQNVDGIPMSVVSMAYHSVRTQDRMGKLCSSVTGDEDPEGGSAADPASCGEAVLMAAFRSNQIQSGRGYWISAANRQLHALLEDAPRSPSGAISHRVEQTQLWSDSLYMTPPFLASYGLYTSNQTLLQLAYDQVRLYRDGLRIQSGPAQNLYGHILNIRNGTQLPQWMDGGAWATGEGWATGGMLRVLASIAQSPFSDAMQDQKTDLVNWINEILDAAYPFLDSSLNLFHNYLNDSSTFTDAAGSAMIAYSTFRLASMGTGHGTHVPAAEKVYQALQKTMSPYGAFRTPVVNVLSFTSAGGTAPESLAFLLLLEAARRDYHAGNVTGIDGPGTGSDANAAGVNAPPVALLVVLLPIVSVLAAVLL